MGVASHRSNAQATPAPGVFGSGTVTNLTAVGHDASAIQTGVGTEDVGMSAQWSFPVFPAGASAVTLKASWSITGTLSGAGATSQFEINHSTNGGSSWAATVVRSNVNAADSGTISVTLSASQDISQVKVRDLFLCSVLDAGSESAEGTMTFSVLQVEILYPDGGGAVG